MLWVGSTMLQLWVILYSYSNYVHTTGVTYMANKQKLEQKLGEALGLEMAAQSKECTWN